MAYNRLIKREWVSEWVLPGKMWTVYPFYLSISYMLLFLFLTSVINSVLPDYQMVCSILAFSDIENLPNSKTNLPNSVQHFAKYKNKNPEYFPNILKFRQIWSHWSELQIVPNRWINVDSVLLTQTSSEIWLTIKKNSYLFVCRDVTGVEISLALVEQINHHHLVLANKIRPK